MSKTKVFWGNQHRTINLDSKWTVKNLVRLTKKTLIVSVRLTKKTLIVSAKVCAVAWIVVIGAYSYNHYHPLIVWQEKVVEIPIREFPPMLMKICKAESGLRQFNKDGSVLRGRVNPSDVGFCQINEPIWNDTARKLGYDIYTEQGNKDMAMYIYLNFGSDPWNSSKTGWSK